MPSIDEELLVALCESGRLVCLAEQNNGYIFQNLLKVQYRRRRDLTATLHRIVAINTLDPNGRSWFIHSGTYEELIAAFDLAPSQIAATLENRLKR